MLEVKHVTKSYIKGGTPAIEDISFRWSRGKYMDLIWTKWFRKDDIDQVYYRNLVDR